MKFSTLFCRFDRWKLVDIFDSFQVFRFDLIGFKSFPWYYLVLKTLLLNYLENLPSCICCHSTSCRQTILKIHFLSISKCQYPNWCYVSFYNISKSLTFETILVDLIVLFPRPHTHTHTCRKKKFTSNCKKLMEIAQFHQVLDNETSIFTLAHWRNPIQMK